MYAIVDRHAQLVATPPDPVVPPEQIVSELCAAVTRQDALGRRGRA